jgi:DNA-binding IclR family transcriptional regulator
MTKSSEQSAVSLKRGLDVLRTFQADNVTLSHNELVTRTGLPKSTLARFTYTLTRLGYLYQDDALGGYRLGDKVADLGRVLLADLPVCRIARPLIQEMADTHNIAVALGAGDRESMVYIAYCYGRDAATRRMRTGSVVPMGRTAMGRAYLAGLPPALRARHVAQIGEKAGAGADEQIAGIEKSARDIKRDGFCFLEGEYRREISSLAAPVILDQGDVVLALNCAFAPHIFTERQVGEVLGPALMEVAGKIANKMADLGLTFWDD